MNKSDAEQPSKRIFRQEYELNPKLCLHCGNKIPFEKRFGKFCNHSCSALHTNAGSIKNPRKMKNCPNCGNSFWGQNKYCADCIEKRVYNSKVKLEDAKSEPSRRRRLLESREHRCELCGLTEWRGLPIALDVHHIDGDTDNNMEANLQLLCPNCHAQSDNRKSRNKNGRRQLMRRKRYANGQTW